MSEDAMAAFHFAAGLAFSSSAVRMVIHGHSLGTGVTTRMAAKLEAQGGNAGLRKRDYSSVLIDN